MNIVISNENHSIDSISIAAEDFGKAPAPELSATYFLQVSQDQVLRDFEQFYDDYVKDAKTHGIDEDEVVERSLVELQFPSWTDLIETHPEAAGAFLKHVVFDLLNIVFLPKRDMQPRFYIRTVDSLEVQGEGVLLSGLAIDYRQALINRARERLPDAVPCEQPGYGFNSGYWDEED